MLRKLWRDDGGALIATEWVFVATIMILGCVAGLAATRNAVNSQLEGIGQAILTLDPEYEISGIHNREATTPASVFIRNEIHVDALRGPKTQPPRTMPEAEWQRLLKTDLQDVCD